MYHVETFHNGWNFAIVIPYAGKRRSRQAAIAFADNAGKPARVLSRRGRVVYQTGTPLAEPLEVVVNGTIVFTNRHGGRIKADDGFWNFCWSDSLLDRRRVGHAVPVTFDPVTHDGKRAATNVKEAQCY